MNYSNMTDKELLRCEPKTDMEKELLLRLEDKERKMARVVGSVLNKLPSVIEDTIYCFVEDLDKG